MTGGSTHAPGPRGRSPYLPTPSQIATLSFPSSKLGNALVPRSSASQTHASSCQPGIGEAGASRALGLPSWSLVTSVWSRRPYLPHPLANRQQLLHHRVAIRLAALEAEGVVDGLIEGVEAVVDAAAA